MISYGDIRQLAGLLEGEAHFGFYNSPVISLHMTDRDVVAQAAAFMGATHISNERVNDPVRKPAFKFALNGVRAIAWMFILFPFLGQRRREQVRKVVVKWKAAGTANKFKIRCKHGHEFNEANTYTFFVNGRRRRNCRVCDRKKAA